MSSVPLCGSANLLERSSRILFSIGQQAGILDFWAMHRIALSRQRMKRASVFNRNYSASGGVFHSLAKENAARRTQAKRVQLNFLLPQFPALRQPSGWPVY
jgi:hypothetical protein